MKARVNAKNCKIKVTTYFNEYYLNFNADDVLEIEVDEKVYPEDDLEFKEYYGG